MFFFKHAFNKTKFIIDDELTHTIIGCVMKVHTALRPLLLESAYGSCLRHELIGENLRIEVEKPIPIT